MRELPSGYLRLREALNVPDALERDRLVRDIMRVRRLMRESIAEAGHWNRTHPNETPISLDFEYAMIAWCDGKGPFPEVPDVR